MKKILTLCLILTALTAPAQSNRDIDSIKTLLQANREDTGTANTINDLCIRLRGAGDLVGSKTYAGKELSLSQKIGFKKGEANAYVQLGNADNWLGNYADALKHFYKALRIRESIKDFKGIANVYLNIGNISLYQKNYEDALKNYTLSMEMQKKINNKHGIANSYNCIAIVNNERNNYSEALRNYDLALKIYESIGDKNDIAYIYLGMAEIFAKHDNNADAMNKLQQSLSIMEEVNDEKGKAECYLNIGMLLFKENKFYNAKQTLTKSLALSRKIGNKNALKINYEILSATDSAMGNFSSAYENHKMFLTYKDSLFNEESTRNTVKSQMQYEFEKKEDAVKSEQEKKDVISEQEKKKQRIIIYSVSVGLLLVLLLAVFIFRGYKQKQKANTIITKQKKIVDERNEEITASIRYALRIQQAILPTNDFMQSAMPEHLLFFEPKDILSGDAYYVDKKDNKIIWATLDATGHGIPSSLLNALASNALSEIIKNGETTPSKILDKFNKRINESLHKTDDNSIRDGFDMTLCSLDKENMILNFSGANNPLWIIRGGEIIEYKTDKMPIGQMYKTDSYTNQEVKLQSGDTIYSFSDGICDLHSEDDKKFMKKRLREMLISFQDKPMSEQKKIISETLSQWKGDAEQVDDMILIGVRV